MLNIVLFGPPGAGKGTQSQIVMNRYNLMHLSTGDILRNAMDRKTPRGIQAKKYMSRGELVPDELVIGIIGRRLDEYLNKTNGFIFDGFPRTTLQAKEFDIILAQKQISITLMIELEVDHDELISRLMKRGQLCGRSDDQDIDVINNRINIYNQSTRPLMEYYKAQGKYVGINGMGDVDEIYQRICSVIDKEIQK
ncbi:adenylate kinase [Perlabentimonas gracilis]|uniref:adenylate kinase n=1 Tax=Perlabentimonas gracilis TaxID=2715279 RepID=UPI001407D24E|nr:adenylate kinase [Perlabentimonas gracilis]NHB68411.1 adenylate kinase [Perlabentimonas gracilis]